MFKSLTRVHTTLILTYSFLFTIAAYTTWHALTMFPPGYFFERNPLSAYLFAHIGIVPTFSLMFFVTIVVMLIIPIIFKPSPKIGIVANCIIVIIVAFDAGGNVFHLTDFPLLSFADEGMNIFHWLVWGRV